MEDLIKKMREDALSNGQPILREQSFNVLEDLIMAAYNDAHNKIDTMQEEGMKEATGGVNFGGLKIPF